MPPWETYRHLLTYPHKTTTLELHRIIVRIVASISSITDFVSNATMCFDE